MFRHILVPTDFGDASARARDIALELARRFDARVTLLHVWTVPNAAYAEGLSWPTEDLEAAAQRALDAELATAAKIRPGTQAKLRVGLAWERILESAKEIGADLIVMGTHGRRGISRLVIGSVAEKLVRLSPVPVLTVGAEPEVKS
ncbi:MAG: universal stress protein [Deltaproteobacteria bacterium]|nr:universal stress protein [Deltaproteobacteria bacterium]